MKKFWGIVAVMIGLSILSGCTTGEVASTVKNKEKESNKKDEKEITVWVKKNINDQADKELIARLEEYGKQKGCKIVVELIPSSNIVEKYSVAVESGQTPDIGMLTDQFINQYYKAGILTPLNDVVEELEMKNGELFDAPVQVATFDDQVYAVPCYAGTQALFYRKDYLEQAGYSEPPKTWEEFGEIAKAVTEKVEGVYGAGIAYGRCPDTENLSRSLLMANGGGMFNKEGELDIDNPLNLVSLKQFTDWYLVDQSVPPTCANWDDSGNNKAYLSGQVAMVVNAPSIVMAIQEDEYKDQPVSKNTGVALLPRGTDNTSVFCSSIYYSIFNNTEDPELCKDIIKYIMDIEWYTDWMNKVAPSIQPVYTALKEEEVWKDPMNKPFIDSVEYQRYQGYPGEYSLVASDVYNSYIMTDILQKIIVEKVTPEEAVAAQMGRLTEIVNKYK